jgi:hypothetical protein
MESIDAGPAERVLGDLRLCPACYVVTWIDQGGMHVEQGVPLKDGLELDCEFLTTASVKQQTLS